MAHYWGETQAFRILFPTNEKKISMDDEGQAPARLHRRGRILSGVFGICSVCSMGCELRPRTWLCANPKQDIKGGVARSLQRFLKSYSL